MPIENSGSPPAVDDLSVAIKVGHALTEIDTIGRRFGMILREIKPGMARLGMAVTAEMIGGHGLCHGAFLFALADTACGYASASRNVRTLSQGMASSFVAQVRPGEELEAVAEEVAATRGSAWYDVRLTDSGGAVVGLFRAQCRVMPGSVIP